ncbi:type II toxin-antitoxin system antitoxin DNA ADP-ribosyl glycohydrolase DarG [Parathalassolituus penaei]|uniref:Macro domain-containing protein n=1 Tax=Parathalassolituus penaei TaxID=2997323 RepID=A0A9X3EBL0_9GAMM|nr:macro domain-containing protein [Parathalassolituus penaei]MCY0964542.1 macro domain-containing protein [Parathalassolituus penaei]
MIRYTTGNLLEADVDALVNTVNTVGVMGKGIALMFKERFPANMRAYALACKQQQVQTGQMFVTETGELSGPKWIVNFPTKQHWRSPSRMEWIDTGLQDLKRFICEQQVRSIAIPPLGAGNGGLAWEQVKPRIEQTLADLDNVDVLIYEPTARYQNVAKPQGVKALTPARAMIAELVRRYWTLGIDCSLLEIQKLAWFLQRAIQQNGQQDVLKLNFQALNYGPYANNLDHLLNALDGSYLKADKRIPDSDPLDVIWFRDDQKATLDAWFKSEGKDWIPTLDQAAQTIEGFESPFGMELLSTVDWAISRMHADPTLEGIRTAISQWPAGPQWAARKQQLFGDQHLQMALDRLVDQSRQLG